MNNENSKQKMQSVKNARAYISHKAGAARRPFGKYLERMEARLSARVFRRFTAQQKWIIDRMESLSFFDSAKGFARIETKTIYDEINALLDDIPGNEGIVDDIVGTARPTYKKGVQNGINDLDLARYGIDFSLVNEQAVKYLQDLKDLQLSNYRGSINRQTRDRIRQILRESADTGRSYTETSKLIKEQGDAGVFSKARGELIAVNQIGHAFGQGNIEIVDAFRKQTGSIVQKFWQTVEDTRVTEECALNEDVGWIGFDEGFPSGDERAPRASNPRCRCTTTFRTVDTQGNPT